MIGMVAGLDKETEVGTVVPKIEKRRQCSLSELNIDGASTA